MHVLHLFLISVRCKRCKFQFFFKLNWTFYYWRAIFSDVKASVFTSVQIIHRCKSSTFFFIKILHFFFQILNFFFYSYASIESITCNKDNPQASIQNITSQQTPSKIKNQEHNTTNSIAFNLQIKANSNVIDTTIHHPKWKSKQFITQ